MALPQPSFVTLPDGRTLAYNEFGDLDGHPIVYCHGWPGSRLDVLPVADAARDAGMRLISPDRPGFGHSPMQEGRSLIGWAADVHALTLSLDVPRYSVIGWSGGGPSAIACAFALSQYVHKVGVVSGTGPIYNWELRKHLSRANRSAARMARRWPLLLRLYMTLMGWGVERMSEERVIRMIASSLSESDKKVLEADPEAAEQFVATGREAFRQGGAGATVDLELMAKPWGFELSHISTEVLLWHGTEDEDVGIANALEYQKLLLNPRLKVYEGQGHLIFLSHAKEMFTALKEGAPVKPA